MLSVACSSFTISNIRIVCMISILDNFPGKETVTARKNTPTCAHGKKSQDVIFAVARSDAVPDGGQY